MKNKVVEETVDQAAHTVVTILIYLISLKSDQGLVVIHAKSMGLKTLKKLLYLGTLMNLIYSFYIDA